MTNKDIERKLNQAVTNAVPDVLDSVLSKCKDTKGQVIYMNEKKKNSWLKRVSIAAASFGIVLASAFILRGYKINNTIDSIVFMDVNPSIEISINQKERVIAVTAQNKDGEKVIGDMDFKGSKLDVTVNALIGSMVRNGYLSELANSILISVDNANEQEAQALQKKLADEISALLTTNTFRGAVLSQTVSSNKDLVKLAEQYGITIGKAQLIHQIIENNSAYTFENLAALSINELNLLCQGGNKEVESVTSVGVASEKAYIGIEKAKEIAFSHAGLNATNVSDLEIELDYDNSLMVYDIDFKCNGYEYNYEVNARTGEVIKSEKEKDDDYTPSNKTVNNNTDKNNIAGKEKTNYIGEAKAKEIAIAHAKCDSVNIKEYEVEMDTENGVDMYEIEFKCNGYEYSYEINAKTGTILEFDKEADD